MFCPYCGVKNNQESLFCSNCGRRLEKVLEATESKQGDSSQLPNKPNTLNQDKIDKAVNPDMKKWAILSVVIPIVAIIWYWFIGLTFYLAVFIAAAGFGFAQKGEMADKKLAIIGKLLNGILMGMAMVVVVSRIIILISQK